MEIKTLNEQIERLKELVRKCYATVAGKNGTVPEVGERTMENLPASINSIKHLDPADLDAAWDAFKDNTGMIPKEEQTIGNLKYAIRMNQEEMDVNEINFVDFNGMVLSMTIEEVMQLTEMPQPNEYYNLTFEHWTKTLEEIQDGRCHTVGATYHTTDGCDYYVVEVGDDKLVKLITSNTLINGTVNWGDGVVNNEAWHTYTNEGVYIIKIENYSKFTFYSNVESLIECYLGESVDRSSIRQLEEFTYLKKICIPDNGTPYGFNSPYWIDGCLKLKSLILGNSYIGGEIKCSSIYPQAPELMYLVADGVTTFQVGSFINLKCFSAKNAVETMATFPCYSYARLKHVVFDKIENIGARMFYWDGSADTLIRVNYLDIIDLPDTVKSIGNYAFRMCSPKVYLRTLTPPTLGGANDIFREFKHYHVLTEVHVRKDATYTDAEGNTYTGLEAYANATNWSVLYAKTSEYTFIADL